MKVLVVNSYTPNSKAFFQYQLTIRKVFAEYNNSANQLFIEMHTHNSIAHLLDYSYQVTCKIIQNYFGVFIEGKTSMKPWDPHSQHILYLIKICHKLKKVKTVNQLLFCSSFAFNCLVYLSSTGLLQENSFFPLKVINNQRFTNIKKIKQFIEQNKKIQINNHYLNNVTGDIYALNNYQNALQPVYNCGMLTQLGMNFKKNKQESTRFRNNKSHISFNRIPCLYTQPVNQQEIYVTIINKYLNYYLFKNIKNYFLALSRQKWQTHRFVPIGTYQFKILSQNHQNIIIIEINDGLTIGTFFKIHMKYKQTIIFLRNFIQNHLCPKKKKKTKLFDWKLIKKKSEVNLFETFKISVNTKAMSRPLKLSKERSITLQKYKSKKTPQVCTFRTQSNYCNNFEYF